MTGWLQKFGAGMVAIALAVPGAGTALAQNAAQVSNTPQGGFTMKVNRRPGADQRGGARRQNQQTGR